MLIYFKFYIRFNRKNKNKSYIDIKTNKKTLFGFNILLCVKLKL